MSRKPAVVTRAVGAVLPSIRALVATVVPCPNDVTFGGGTFGRGKIQCMPHSSQATDLGWSFVEEVRSSLARDFAD